MKKFLFIFLVLTQWLWAANRDIVDGTYLDFQESGADLVATVIDFALTADADCGDFDIQSIDKLEGFDAGIYIDMGADTLLELVSDTLLELTAPNIKLEFDAAAYLNIATADGGVTTISQVSDGADGIVIGDGTDTVAIASAGLDLDTSGNLTNVGTIASGVVTVTGLINTSVGLDAVGAVDMDYGSVDVLDHTFVEADSTFIIDNGITSVGEDIGSATAEWNDLFLNDGGIIKLGNDQDVTITHVADTGILVNLEVEVDGTLDADGLVALGDNGDTVTIDSSDWDIGATGDMTGIGSLTMDGTFTDGTMSIASGAATAVTSLTFTGADANPNAAGEIQYDSAIAGIMSGGGLRWFDDDSVRLLVDLETDPSDDDYVVAYDSTADGFYMKVDDDSGGATAYDDIGNPDAAGSIPFDDTETATYVTATTATDFFHVNASGTFGDISIFKVTQDTGNPTDGALAEFSTADAEDNVDQLLLGNGTDDYVTFRIIEDGTLTIDVTSDGTPSTEFSDLITASGGVTSIGTIEGATLTEGGVGVPNLNETDWVAAAEMADADHGDVAWSGGDATVQAMTVNDATTGTYYPGMFADDTGADKPIYTDGALTFTQATGTLAATEFSGGGASLTAVDAATGDSATDFFDAGEIADARISDTLTSSSCTGNAATATLAADFALSADADAGDNDITSVDKLEGVTTATYIDLGEANTIKMLSSAGAIYLSDNLTNATQKDARWGTPHYTNAQEPFIWAVPVSAATSNVLNLGGGTSHGNASTSVKFWSAANATTTTGTERGKVDKDGNWYFGDGVYTNYSLIDSTGDFSQAGSATTTIATNIKAMPHMWSFTVPDPNTFYDTAQEVLILAKTTAALKVTAIEVTSDADPASETTLTLKYADAFIGLANAATVATITTANGIYSSSGDSDAIPASKCVYVAFGSDPDAAIEQTSFQFVWDYD